MYQAKERLSELIAVRLTPSSSHELRYVARKSKISKSQVIRQALNILFMELNECQSLEADNVHSEG